MFAMKLPMPNYSRLYSLPDSQHPAPLILPWEHTSREQLLATKRKRFKRTRQQEQFIRDFLKQELNAKLSPRSERRYRSATTSEPHVNALIHLSVANVARYTDALRAGGSWLSDKGSFSLEALLRAKRLEEISEAPPILNPPEPADVWEARKNEFGGWPPLLSVAFPELRRWDDHFVRLAQGALGGDFGPSIAPGSWLLLKRVESIPDVDEEGRETGWKRPIYVVRRGLDMICGYLEREGAQLAVIDRYRDPARAAFPVDQLNQLNRVAGVAIPVL
jgi:hypothetical protein